MPVSIALSTAATSECSAGGRSLRSFDQVDRRFILEEKAMLKG
jgi:hypothetical protein